MTRSWRSTLRHAPSTWVPAGSTRGGEGEARGKCLVLDLALGLRTSAHSTQLRPDATQDDPAAIALAHSGPDDEVGGQGGYHFDKPEDLKELAAQRSQESEGRSRPGGGGDRHQPDPHALFLSAALGMDQGRRGQHAEGGHQPDQNLVTRMPLRGPKVCASALYSLFTCMGAVQGMSLLATIHSGICLCLCHQPSRLRL